MKNNENNFLNTEENEIKKINLIISTQNSKIERINEFLINIIDIYIQYIKLSKEFSKKLENLAMKLKPDDRTFEGQIIQVFQSLLLFNSNSLNEMIKDMNIFYEEENKNCCEINDINNFKNFKDVYLERYKKTFDSYKLYENNVNNLENYLIKKELNIIKEKEENKKDNNNDIKMVYNNQNLFIDNLNECNDILKNLFDYFSSEKNKMRLKIFNFCSKFNENIMNYLKKLKETISNQKLVLDDLTKNYNLDLIEEKEFKNHYLKPNPYLLKCLKISENNENSENKEKLLEKEESKKNKLSISQALHILQIFRNNGLILDKETETKEKQENNKIKIKNFVDNLFNNNDKNIINDEIDINKQKMISLLNEKINQTFFLNYLNEYRIKGKFILNKNSLNTLGYLFQYLNEIIIKNLDVKLFNQLLIMIFTFYYQDISSDISKKYYLYKYIENNENYKKRKLWEDYLKGLILSDIKESHNNEDINLNYINFLNIMSVIKSMTDLHLGKDFINEFIEYINITYKLKEDQIIQINYMLNDSEYGSFNENERSTVSTEINEILNQSFANSLDNLNDNRFSNNSNIIINKNLEQDNNININTTTDNKNESDGSVESIDIEVMPKNK